MTKEGGAGRRAGRNRPTGEETDRAFFGHLCAHGPTSRSDVASAIGISRPTASESATRLLDRNLIRDVGIQSRPRGRGAVNYAVNDEVGHSVGLSVSSGRVIFASDGISGAEQLKTEVMLETGITADRLMEVIRQVVEEYHAVVSSPCLSVAVSQANPVNQRSGQVHPLPGAPFSEGHWNLVEEYFADSSAVLTIDNDVNWAALAEQSLGSATELDDVLVVHIGPGIGGALILGGQLQRGGHGLAGELGYVRHHGIPLMEKIRRIIDLDQAAPSIDVDAVRHFFSAGDPRGHEIAAILADVIADVCLVIDPAGLVLTGPLGVDRDVARLLTRQIMERLLKPDTEVISSSLGPDASFLGARNFSLARAQERVWA